MHKYALGSPEDNLIQLYHESEKQPESPVFPVGVRRVIYEHVHDIPALIIDPPRLKPAVVRGLAVPKIQGFSPSFPIDGERRFCDGRKRRYGGGER
jgi:hypothetical protein